MKQLRHAATIAMVLAFLAAAPTPGHAGVLLDPKDAPEWSVREWINGSPGRMAGLRGKVVVIHFFQMWCPACNDFSFPLVNRWYDMYRERSEIEIVSIHSVFEGHSQQTPGKLRQYLMERGIEHKVGVDSHGRPDDVEPETMRRYETGGSPHVVVVDKFGKIRFSHFGTFEPVVVESFIERLVKEKDPQKKKKSRGSSKRGRGGRRR